MKITASRKKWFFIDQHIEVDSYLSPVALIKTRENDNAIRYLMRSAIKQGCSVVTYGSSTDYYKYVHDIAPVITGTLSHTLLLTDYKAPFITDTCKRAVEDVKACYSDYQFETRYRYMNDRWNGLQIPDPNLRQSFYQIKDGNIEKEKVITESLLVNIIAQAKYTEPLHEVILFLELPCRPITLTAFDTLNSVKQTTNMSIISIYKGNEYNNQQHILFSDAKKITLKVLNEEFYIEHEQISK